MDEHMLRTADGPLPALDARYCEVEQPAGFLLRQPTGACTALVSLMALA